CARDRLRYGLDSW
nr:immunoglobulin heavy chain junction region [Macaca mulatta]